MAGMRCSRLAPVVALVLALAPAWCLAATGSRLSHRVWVLSELPSQGELQDLRSAGVSALAVQVGQLELRGTSSNLTLSKVGDLGSLSGWSVAALVWVDAAAQGQGDAEGFLTQLGPVMRTLPGGGSLLLAARSWSEALPAFATAVAQRLGHTVELAVPAVDLALHLPERGWQGVLPVAVGLGAPDRLGFPATTRQDDIIALDKLAERLVEYRVAVVAVSRATPPPGPRGASLGIVATSGVAEYRPGPRGDVFRLAKPVDWGGTRLEAGRQVELELFDTVRYDADLAEVLRPVRIGFTGVDTVALPPPEPTLGMSRQAWLEYLGGGSPYPRPVIRGQWSGGALRVSLENVGPQSSASATTGNWVEIKPLDALIGDVVLGEFTGVEYGRWEGDSFRRTIAREASVVRFYLTAVCPRCRVEGGAASFVGRPRGVLARWGMRLGNGSDLSGPWQPLP